MFRWNLFYNIWDGVKRGYIPNFIFIALILTEILAEIVKLTHILKPRGHVEIKHITTISDIVFREVKYQISDSIHSTNIDWDIG